jgi:hypothetical protein
MKLQFKVLAMAASMLIAGSAFADPYDLSAFTADATLDYATRSSAIADIVAGPVDLTTLEDSVAIVNQTGADGFAIAMIDQAGDGAGFNMAIIDQDASVSSTVATNFQNGSGHFAFVHQDGAVNATSAVVMQTGVNNSATVYQH